MALKVQCLEISKLAKLGLNTFEHLPEGLRSSG